MSEIRINIIDEDRIISGDMHGSFGYVLVASLTAEPETIEEFESAVERFVDKGIGLVGFLMGVNSYESFV